MYKMKNTLALILILIGFTLNNSIAQSGWSWQNPSINGNTLTSLKMVNANTGYACGNAGTIIKTSNNGASWITLNTGTTSLLYSLDFVDANIGYASGKNGLILKTIDGGSSWETLNSGVTQWLYNIQFLNTNTGYAGGESGMMIKTTDAGATWTEQNTNTPTALFAMHFINTNTGYAGGNIAIVVKTTNGGTNWTQATSIPSGQAILDMDFINANTGFATSFINAVDKTTDGGITWQHIEVETSYGPHIENVQFINSTTGYLCAGDDFSYDKAFIYKSTDAGNTWERQFFQIDSYLNAISFPEGNADVGFAAGLSGDMYKTTNGGANWIALKHTVTTTGFNSVHFPDANTGYAVGYGTVTKTTNGGINWVNLTHPAPSNQSEGVYFINGNTGFIGGEFNNIWKTTNGGLNWASTQPALFSLYHEFYFTDANTGYAAGAQGKISKTTNQGSTWTGQVTGTTWDFRDIEFVDVNTGFAVGLQGTLMKTTNGGVNWVQKANPISNNFGGIAINGNLAIAITEGFGTTIRSTDLGETWTEVLPGSNLGLTSVRLISPTVGFATGYTGRIIKTTDAGLSWFVIPSSTSTNIYDLYFPTPSSAFAVGDNGMIIHTDNSGTFLSGTVKYNDNQQLVTNGRVMALKLNKATNEVIVLGSAMVQANGQYDISNLPPDTAYIAAYPNSNLDFVPTYYPSTIDWENAITVVPNGSVSNINISVFRISNGTAPGVIGGGVFRSVVADTNVVDYAVIYAKIGGLFKSFSSSISNGDYDMKNISNGTYEIHASRLGYQSRTFPYVFSGNISDSLNIFMSPVVTGVSQNGSTVPSGYELKQNYPNPFNPATKITYSIPKGSFVKLNIYDITGRLMTVLQNSFQNAGNYVVDFNASSLSSGVYFYTIDAGDFSATKKMMLLK